MKLCLVLGIAVSVLLSGLNPSLADPHPFSVEAFLEASLSGNEPLLTVSGVKPFSEYSPNPFGQDWEPVSQSTVEVYMRAYNDAVKSGVVHNHELQLFAHPVWGSKKPENNFTISWVNRRAAHRLVESPQLKDLYHRYQITPPRTVDELIALYQAAVEAQGFSSHAPVWANIVVGTCMGYDPFDVEAYALQSHLPTEKKLKNFGIEIPGEDNLLTGYAHYTPEKSPLNLYYERAGRKTLDHYQRVRNLGKSALDVFNYPENISQGLPEYPSNLPIRNARAELGLNGPCSSDGVIKSILGWIHPSKP